MLRSLAVFACCALLACSSSSSSSSDEPEWQFGAAEAEAALAGAWNGTWSAAASSGSIELKLSMASPGATPKCGSRTLSSDLGVKCIDMTSIRLVGTLTTSDGTYKDAPVTGALEVDGTKLTSGFLSLRTAAGETVDANYVQPAFQSGRLQLKDGTATFSLTRATR
ncbi:MAG: hypothetical protein HYV09_34110 [Deltaproteobacteria bacterium]|nr:hypothetical protein [Deltaproteobacteria bacterium]